MSCNVKNEFEYSEEKINSSTLFIGHSGTLTIKTGEQDFSLKDLIKVSFLPNKEIQFETLFLEPRLYELFASGQNFRAIVSYNIFFEDHKAGKIIYTIPTAKFKELSPLGGEKDVVSTLKGKILKEYDTDTFLEFKKIDYKKPKMDPLPEPSISFIDHNVLILNSSEEFPARGRYCLKANDIYLAQLNDKYYICNKYNDKKLVQICENEYELICRGLGVSV